MYPCLISCREHVLQLYKGRRKILQDVVVSASKRVVGFWQITKKNSSLNPYCSCSQKHAGGSYEVSDSTTEGSLSVIGYCVLFVPSVLLYNVSLRAFISNFDIWRLKNDLFWTRSLSYKSYKRMAMSGQHEWYWVQQSNSMMLV